MTLAHLWQTDRVQVLEKRLQQLIAFAGEGALRDGNSTSTELRELLQAVPSEMLGNWIDEALEDRFSDFGFAIQDIVNEIGRRLGFQVEPGPYRGKPGIAGYDGVWRLSAERAIVVESKSSMAYQINLARIAEYQRSAARLFGIDQDQISVLMVVGRDPTDDLESQVRGSRMAWAVRLLGIDSLYKLLRTRESLDDPNVGMQIQDVLTPQEFTRLDRIVELVFATAEDAQGDGETESADLDAEGRGRTPAAFHQDILPQLEKALGTPLVKRSRVTWAAPSGTPVVSCQVSSSRQGKRGEFLFWFGLKKNTAAILEQAEQALCAFGLGSPDRVVVLPFSLIRENLGTFFTSPNPDGTLLHYHVRFILAAERVYLLVDRDSQRIDVTDKLLGKHLPRTGIFATTSTQEVQNNAAVPKKVR